MKYSFKNIILIFFSIYLSLILTSIFIYFYEYKNQVLGDQKILDYCKKKKTYCEKKNLQYFFLNEKKKNPKLSIYSPPIHSLRIKDFTEKELFPLSGVSNSKTLICNETGDYTFIFSDRYGFNNLDKSWNENAEIALLGDSYAFGECVNFDNSIASNLIKNNKSTISLGYGSNGPLTTLGSIKEYGKLIKPKKVFWIFFSGNDLEDLGREKNSDILIKYLEPNFKQDLINKQLFIDKVYANYFDYEIKRLENSWPYKFSLIKIFNLSISINFMRNFFLKKKFSFSKKKINSNKFKIIDNYDFDFFSKIINLAKTEIESWDGELIFVYIPSPKIFHSKDENLANEYQKNKLLKIINSHDLHFIDIEDKIINSGLPINKIYTLGKYHFTKKGYKIVSSQIVNFLNKSK